MSPSGSRSDYDTAISLAHDLLKDSFFEGLRARCSRGEVQILLAGPPCGTASKARCLGPPGPPPLRNRHHLWGFPRLKGKLRRQVLDSNCLYQRALCLSQLVHEAHGLYLIEQPKDPGPPYASFLATPEHRTLLHDTKGTEQSCDQCRYGASSRKSTTLGGTAPGLASSLSLTCNHTEHEQILRGLDSSGSFLTANAKVYQPPLCKALAEAFLQGVADLPETTATLSAEGEHRPPPGLELLDPSATSRLTKGGCYREPDYLVGDKLVSWPWQEIFSLDCSADPSHINLKEFRALRMYLRRRAKRGPKGAGERVLLLCDSRVVVGALAHGRSSSHALNRGLRSLIPICLGSHLYPIPLWIPTGANPSDAPSRKVHLGVWLKKERQAARLRLRARRRCGASPS